MRVTICCLVMIAIVYGVNHGHEHVVKWWDAVDYIGIDGIITAHVVSHYNIYRYDVLQTQ